MNRNQVSITIEKDDSLKDVLNNLASILQEVGEWRKGKSYFVNLGIDVKAVPVASGLERDQLMQSGAIDGMLNEMITTANFINLGKALELVKTNYELPESPSCPVCGSGVDCDGVDSCYCSDCDKSFYMTVLYDVGEEFE